MSDFTVIKQVNHRLCQVLLAGMRVEAATVINSLDKVRVGPPKAPSDTSVSGDGSEHLSVFLYQITEDPYLKNQAFVRSDAATRLRPPPLALRLHYMITPCIRDPESNALVLGAVLETLYDTSTIVLQDPPPPANGQREDVRVLFETISLAELAEVWEALKEPYRLSVAYQVRVPRLESRREFSAVPVGEAISDYGPVPGQRASVGASR